MNSTRLFAVFAAAALAVALVGAAESPASAQVPAQEDASPDLARGEVLFDLCSQCHGASAWGNRMYLAPSIAGLGQWYIEMQLEKFRNGQRGTHFDDISGMRMRPMSLTLTREGDVRSVSAYVASLPPKQPAPSLTGGDAEKGKELFVLCAACHGPNGDGLQVMNAPSLNRTHDWYLVSQLEKFKTGIRGTKPGDITGILMGPNSPMALTLKTEESVLDVVAHIMTLKSQ